MRFLVLAGVVLSLVPAITPSLRAQDDGPKVGYLGVSFRIAKFKDETGMERVAAHIQGLTRGGGAFKAGLQADDYIVAINGEKITGQSQFINAVGSFKAGTTVKIDFYRAGKPQSVEAPLGSWDELPFLALNAGGHTTNITRVLFTPDGKELISVSYDKTIRFWNVETGEPGRILRPPIGFAKNGALYAAALRPDGKRLAVGGALNDNGIFIIDLESGKVDQILTGHTSSISCLSYDQEGTFLASSAEDNTVRIWDLETGSARHVFQGPAEKDKPGLGSQRADLSPDGKRVAGAFRAGKVRVWSLATGQMEFEIDTETMTSGLAWSPDGQTLATGSDNGVVRLWKADGSSSINFFKAPNEVGSIRFTKDGEKLIITWGGIAGSGHGASIIAAKEGAKPQPTMKHDNTVRDSAFSPDDKLAATAGVGNGQFEISLWKSGDSSLVRKMNGKGRVMTAVAWGPKGYVLAWGNKLDGTTVKADHSLERAFDLNELLFADAPNESFQRAIFSQDGLKLERKTNLIAVIKKNTQEIQEFKINYQGDIIRCFTWLPKKRVVIGSAFSFFLADADTGKSIRSFNGHTAEVWALAPSPDGRYLASASTDMTIRIWDPEKSDPLLSLFVADNEWVIWTQEGYYAASPGGERLMGWHLNDGLKKMGRFVPAGQFHKSLFRPDIISRVLPLGSVDKAVAEADRERGKPSQAADVAEILPPAVFLTAPDKLKSQTKEARLEVKAIAKSVGKHPITSVKLIVNGRPHVGDDGVHTFSPGKVGELRLSWNIELKRGATTIAVVAESAVSKGQTEPVEIIYDPAQAAKEPLPNLYVLAVGISEYPKELKLYFAAKDAQVFGKTIQDGSKSLYESVEVKILTDKDASQRSIRQELSKLKKKMTHRDVAIFFFAGHGDVDNDKTFYLLPSDVDPQDLPATAISAGLFKDLVQSIPGRVILIMDACHSGAVGAKRRGNAAITDEFRRDLMNGDSGIIVMCSSTGKEFSLEDPGLQHGIFTKALVEGLSGKADYNKDGIVEFTELDLYVTQRVKELSGGQQHPVTDRPTSVRSFPLSRAAKK